MSGPHDTVAAFEDLVGRAEATAGAKRQADLASYQLQGLSTTLSALAGGDGPPDEVRAALDAIGAFVGGRGLVDPEEGSRLREKVAAYAVVADDLGLDADTLASLLTRWDTTSSASDRRGTARGRRARSASSADGALTACVVCGQRFKRVSKHMSSAHPEEWARSKQG